MVCRISFHIFRTLHWLAGDDQPVVRVVDRIFSNADSRYQTLVGRDSTKKKDCSFLSPMPSRRFASAEWVCVRNRVIDSKRNYGDSPSLNAKILEEFTLHLLRMNENVIHKSILNFKVKRLSSESHESLLSLFTLWAVNTIFMPHSL